MRPGLRRALTGIFGATTAQQVCASLADVVVQPTTVLARFWLSDPDDHLYLAASAGYPNGGGSYNRLDGAFSRIEGGHGKIGQIAMTRQPLIVRGIRGDEEWLANPGWVSRQGVRAFVGLPLIAADRVMGVMAVFDRASPSEEALDELRFIADFAAARLIDLASRDDRLQRARVGEIETVDSVTVAAHGAPVAPAAPVAPVAPAASSIMTRAEVRAREKANIEAALAVTRGKVFGADGAATLLGMRPTTLASRIKALGVTRGRT